MTFSSQDGDLWFRRNQKALETAAERDWALRLIERNKLQPKVVFEYGCSNGWRLAQLQHRYQAECSGCDISKQALADGNRQWSDIVLAEHPADAIPPCGCDLVICYFVLHWLDRHLLFDTINWLDDAVVTGGYLLVGDFFPDVPTKVPYHHREGLWTWKADYAGIFLATGNYRLIDRVIFDHDSGEEGDMSIPPYRRAAVSLLRKEDCYEEVEHGQFR